MWEHDLADWRWGIDVNVLGVIHGIKAFVPILLEQGEGHVVNTCSGNGGFAPIARGRHGRAGHRGLPDDQGRGALPDRKPLHPPGDDGDEGAGARPISRRLPEHRHMGVVAAPTGALRRDPGTSNTRADTGKGGGPLRGRRRPRRIHPARDGRRPGGGRNPGGPILDDGPTHTRRASRGHARRHRSLPAASPTTWSTSSASMPRTQPETEGGKR